MNTNQMKTQNPIMSRRDFIKWMFAMDDNNDKLIKK